MKPFVLNGMFDSISPHLLSTYYIQYILCFPVAKNLPTGFLEEFPAGVAKDAGLIPGLGRSSEVGTGNPLQYSCLGNPMDRRAWQATIHGVAKSWTQMND